MKVDVLQRQTDNTNHLYKFAILYHHGVDDAYEGFVRWEQGRPSCKCIPLKHALTGMFREDFDNAPSLSTASDVPLKVSSGNVEYSIELVRN